MISYVGILFDNKSSISLGELHFHHLVNGEVCMEAPTIEDIVDLPASGRGEYTDGETRLRGM